MNFDIPIYTKETIKPYALWSTNVGPGSKPYELAWKFKIDCDQMFCKFICTKSILSSILNPSFVITIV